MIFNDKDVHGSIAAECVRPALDQRALLQKRIRPNRWMLQPSFDFGERPGTRQILKATARPPLREAGSGPSRGAPLFRVFEGVDNEQTDDMTHGIACALVAKIRPAHGEGKSFFEGDR
jgi:hypothetical protein